MKYLSKIGVYICCLSIVLSGCGSLANSTATPQATVDVLQPNNQPDPYPRDEGDQSAPEGSDEVVPTPILTVNGPNFSIDPIKEGDTTVSGTGPIGLVIDLIDVSLMGELLGRQAIDSDGNFTITLEQPIASQRIVAIALPLNSRASTDALNQLREKVGERPRDYPDVGFVYDSEITQK